MVIVVADDPGQHSSQTEQDTRLYARLAHIPVLEPADSREARDFMKYGLELSEKYRLPVILRTTTRVSHSRSQLEEMPRIESTMPREFIKEPSRHCPLPIWGRRMRSELVAKEAQLREDASASPLNRMELRGGTLGVVASGIAYQYVREAFPESSTLKIGFGYPYPDALLKEFASKVDEVLVVEECEDFLEEHIRALGIKCTGDGLVPKCGELSTGILRKVREQLDGTAAPAVPSRYPVQELPGRPPVFCPGCPHRGIFYALGRHDVIVTGDIGCYSLGVFPPLSRTDVILCMGGGISMAHGLEKAGISKKTVGIVGDSTFFHSGITGLADIVYNRGTSVIIVVDNRTTAMTGHQDHPGTGKTLMGEETNCASIADFGRACGIKRIRTVNPYHLQECIDALKEELDAPEPSLIISQAPCPLKERRPVGKPMNLDGEKCRKCKACLKLGCPAIENCGGSIRINAGMCAGCRSCAEVCRFGAISEIKEEK